MERKAWECSVDSIRRSRPDRKEDRQAGVRRRRSTQWISEKMRRFKQGVDAYDRIKQMIRDRCTEIMGEITKDDLIRVRMGNYQVIKKGAWYYR